MGETTGRHAPYACGKSTAFWPGPVRHTASGRDSLLCELQLLTQARALLLHLVESCTGAVQVLELNVLQSAIIRGASRQQGLSEVQAGSRVVQNTSRPES